MRYVALGDSYTIGTSVAAADRWPDRLVAALGPVEPTLELVANLGVNGYTSADLIRDELPRLERLRPEFATVLIGVNDVVRRVPPETYVANVERILDELLGRLPVSRIVTVATPDLHGHAGGRGLRRSSAAARRHRRRQRDDGPTRRRPGDRLGRHVRPLAPRGR